MNSRKPRTFDNGGKRAGKCISVRGNVLAYGEMYLRTGKCISARGNVFAYGEMYFRGKACSKDNFLFERVNSWVHHIWRFRVKGSCARMKTN